MDTPRPLTPREVCVLRGARDGLTNAEIALVLRMSVNTVKNHLVNVNQKLDTRDRNQAVIAALKRGQLELGEDNGWGVARGWQHLWYHASN